MDKTLESFQFSMEAEVQSFQVRPDGKIWFHCIGDWFQEIAWRHANSGGFGTEIGESNLMWALARLEIRSKKLPEWGDRFKLFTAGRGVNKIFAFREFLLTDESGERLVEGMSSWLLLDSKSKRPQSPESVLPSSLFDPKLKPDWEPAKVRIPSGEPNLSHVEVVPSDVDLYHHVNNTSYIRWAENLLFKENEFPSSCLINFLSESHLGDQVQLRSIPSEKGFFVEGSAQDSKVFASQWI